MFKASRRFTILFNSNRQLWDSPISVEHLMKSSVISINEEIKHALEKQHPIVALESTIITHGLPYPDNVKCAMSVENKIREKGGVPATIAIIGGKVKVGLTPEEIERLGDTSKSNPIKTSRRDFPYVIGNKLNGGTTVSGTLIVANKMGISVFATGGIGGVHREGEKTFDISADLIELGRSQVAVVSSGVKSILDIPKTLEYLETQGVFVATYGETTEFPAFYSRISGCHAPYSVSSPVEAAKIISSNIMLNLKSGMLFAVPVPEENALDNREIQEAIEKALEEAKECKIRGKQITPFLLRKIWEITQGKSLHTNIALIENNATVAAHIAVELEKLRKSNTPTNSSNSGSNKRKDGIVVIGGSNLDICAKLDDEEIKLDGRMHPSKFSYIAGGVARNIFEALTKMNSSPTLITAIGDDEPGKILKSTMPYQLLNKMKIIKGQNTGQCIIVLNSKGDCSCLLADFGITEQIRPEMIMQNKEEILRARMIVLDANLNITCIEEILKTAMENNIPVFFEPTDVVISSKPFQTQYWKAVKFISPNVNELQFIASKLNIIRAEKNLEHLNEIAEIAKRLAELIDNVIVTMGEKGVLVARKAEAYEPFLYNSKNKKVLIRHYPGETMKSIVNVSGAGDCLASGIIVSMLEGLPEEICMSVGLTAAKKALQSHLSVAAVMFDQNDISWKKKAKYIEL